MTPEATGVNLRAGTINRESCVINPAFSHLDPDTRDELLTALADAAGLLHKRRLETSGGFSAAQDYVVSGNAPDIHLRDLIVQGYSELPRDAETQRLRADLRRLTYQLFKFHL